MPIAVFSSSARAVADVGHLLRFRAAGRRRRTTALVAAVVAGVTIAVASAPAWVAGAGSDDGDARDLLLLLPTALTGFVGLAVVSAAASGGGRELLPRDPAAVHPISPTTDHLGALLLAPLTIAWALQAWLLLGVTAYAVGPSLLVPAQTLVLLWLVVGTAFGQVVAWSLEGVRRTRHGVLAVRGLGLVVVAGALVLQATGRLVPALDRLPTTEVVVSMVSGWSIRWGLSVLVGVVAALALVALGAVPAHLAARRTPSEERRAESGRYPARRPSTSALGTLVRLDRGSVWRAVPIRRGIVVLALGPALVAVLGGLGWDTMTVLPGLVASGGALLYGVNAWCLDGRGALWRESLPVDPRMLFDARAYVLGELLLAAALVTVSVAAVRAGVPSPSELVALLATLVVVTVQVVGAAMRWSAQRPYAVDLRSARATPAPPSTMVGYSARLALSTTLTGLVFSVLSHVTVVVAPLVALAMVAWSLARLLRTRAAWADPTERARVLTTVAAG